MEQKLIFENETHIVVEHGVVKIKEGYVRSSDPDGWKQKITIVRIKHSEERVRLNDLTEQGYITNILLNNQGGVSIEYSKEKTKEVPEYPVMTQLLNKFQGKSFFEVLSGMGYKNE